MLKRECAEEKEPKECRLQSRLVDGNDEWSEFGRRLAIEMRGGNWEAVEQIIGEARQSAAAQHGRWRDPDRRSLSDLLHREADRSLNRSIEALSRGGIYFVADLRAQNRRHLLSLEGLKHDGLDALLNALEAIEIRIPHLRAHGDNEHWKATRKRLILHNRICAIMQEHGPITLRELMGSLQAGARLDEVQNVLQHYKGYTSVESGGQQFWGLK